MWTFTVLYILALGSCQAAEKDNSTKMYYTKLSIDRSIIANMTNILGTFPTKSDLHINDLKITTTCETNVRKCECAPDHVWGEDVCRAKKSCCVQTSCTFEKTSSSVCISKNTVHITGSLSLNVKIYKACLQDKTTEEYKNCHGPLLKKMKEVYSTLKGFDTLTIKQFRIGSIIADFEMTFVSDIEPEILRNKSIELTEALQAHLTLETTGVVQMQIPDDLVPYHEPTNINCTSKKDLGTQPEWHLKNQEDTHSITMGTVSKITKTPRFTSVKLTKVDELWAGEYKCSYIKENNNITITHKANATLNVCLLPEILTYTEPDFPRCRTLSENLIVEAKCKIRNDRSKDSYTVVWSGEHVTPSVSPDGLEYTAKYFIDCSDPTNNTKPVNCTFKNSCNQTTFGKVDMETINVGDLFCKAEGEWRDTKANFTAQLKCQNKVGVRTRHCQQNTTWGQEVIHCVDSSLNDVLRYAIISDIGLGILNENAAEVFSDFKNVTETKSIMDFPNMNASVEVLSTMRNKLRTMAAESVEDFLDSSSHLLNKTLQSPWGVQPDNSSSLAERYLSSVEELIHIANMTRNSTKNNLDVRMCEGDRCVNNVFNVSIALQSSDHGVVKATGFQNLGDYLPHNDSEKPNSIVVSTTVEKGKEQARIRITFSLLKERRRNVKMTCVAWDNSSHEWSSKGCDWEGPSSEGVCTCSHLSSFTILMSKYPVKLEGLTQMTYVGLSISIVSLVIGLAIELIVWSDVTSTSTLYLRHTAHVNISLCLLIANCCFLASSDPDELSAVWCKISTVIKHFFYLAMFFWMLCLSTTLLHQAVFLFHKVSKRIYLRYSFVLGYACPLLIVSITFFTNQSGAKDSYYSSESCWLVYNGGMSGSIYTFVIPVGIIVFVNAFSMLVVIMKLLDHHQNTEASQEKEKMAAKAVVRSVILLTPIFGLTWFVGFAILVLDLASGSYVQIFHYAFNLMNTFQGLFILLTTCLGDRKTREALLKRFRKKVPGSISESTTKLDSSTLK